jgi:hypothetical protein
MRNGIVNVNNTFFTNVTIAKSISTALYVLNSELKINGTMNILDNTGIYGGGISLYFSGGLILYPNSELNLIRNHAIKKGGGIFINLLNIRCYIWPGLDYYSGKRVITFTNNTAGEVGDDIYGTNLHYCDNDNITFVTHNGDINQATDPHILCFCTSSVYNECSFAVPPTQYIFPGQKVKFSIAQWGYGYSTQYSITSGMINIYLDGVHVDIQSIEPYCTPLSYTPRLTNLSDDLHNLMT